MKKTLFLMSLALGAWTFQACNNTSNKDSVEQAEEVNEDKEDAGTITEATEDDSEFAIMAASGGMMEVELGRMAQEKAANPAVKQFGAMMVAEHTKANEELKAIAAKRNITLPTTLGEKHQKHVDELSKLSGKEFDDKYLDLMVEDHEEDVEQFQKAAAEAKDTDMRAFAAKTLPNLQKHLEKVTALNKTLD